MSLSLTVKHTDTGWYWVVDSDHIVLSGTGATFEEAQVEGRRMAEKVWDDRSKSNCVASLRANLAAALARAEKAEAALATAREEGAKKEREAVLTHLHYYQFYVVMDDNEGRRDLFEGCAHDIKKGVHLQW